MTKKISLVSISILLISWSISAETIYKSNILGMKLEQLDEIPKTKDEYFLLSSDEEIAVDYLFKGSKLYFSRSTTYVDEKCIIITEKENETETVITEDGLVISELIEKNNNESELVEYEYKDRAISKVKNYMNDFLLYTDSYCYSKSGRLLEVVRTYEEGQKTYFSVTFNDGKVSSYMLKSEDSTSYLLFDKYGVLYSDLSHSKSGNERREYGRLENGKYWVLTTYKDSGETLKNIYDRYDKILQSTSKNAQGAIEKELFWTYTDNVVASLKIRREKITELYLYSYKGREKLKELKYYRNGVFLQKTTYTDENNYIETLYRYEKPAIKIEYINGKRSTVTNIQE